MKVLLLLLLTAVVAYAAHAPKLHQDASVHWLNFTSTYGKYYHTGAEAQMRYKIFKKNLKVIDKLNHHQSSATFAINQFADLSPAEFARLYLMPNYRPAFSLDNYKPVLSNNDAIPDTYDWRDKNVITPVKDQAQCGSCWAFSATEEIESMWILKGNKAVNLAPQQIVDCDKTDAGCNGGDTPTAFQYVIKAGGMEAETSYPYRALDQKCAFNSALVAAKISSWSYAVKGKNETEMLSALYTAGPLSICVEAEVWQYYKNGVLSSNCGQDLDHCVQLVGFGTDAATQKPFWNIRNSWGTAWGEAGYIRVQRDQKNLCGVASEVTVVGI